MCVCVREREREKRREIPGAPPGGMVNVPALRFGFESSGSRVQGSGFRVQGSGSRVQGAGFSGYMWRTG